MLQNLDLITLPALNRPEGLREQLMQIAWAGEMEGWLTSTPSWHLVADEGAAAEWEPALRAGLEQPVEVSAPLQALQMAALTATRATQAEAQANLLPVEFATRYQQRFVDRLWMGGLGAVVALYIIGVAVYLVALEVALIRTRGVEQQVAEVAPAYTNAMEIKARYGVLQRPPGTQIRRPGLLEGPGRAAPRQRHPRGLQFQRRQAPEPDRHRPHRSATGTAPVRWRHAQIR